MPFVAIPGGGAGTLRLWVEWTIPPDQAAGQNETVITFKALSRMGSVEISKAEIKFSGHQAIVTVFGGFQQDPKRFHEHRHSYGTYITAEKLYREHGYDVFAFRPDTSYVLARGELIDAVKHRGIQHATIVGYSMGEGKHIDLLRRFWRP